MIAKKCKLILIMSAFFCLTSCVSMPGQEPFGKETFSAEDAESAYEAVSESIAQAEFESMGGYIVSVSGALDDNFREYQIYKTDEYDVVSYEGYYAEYLWYDGWLYCYADRNLTYRDMSWGEFNAEEYAQQQWVFAQQLLGRADAELTYKYIPMASGNQYLLTAEYDEVVLDGQPVRFIQLSFYLDENGVYDGFGLSWQKPHGETDRVISISFFPYEGSTSLQAERHIWSFGNELGLTEEVIPALNDQEDHRERSLAVIKSLDFETLRKESAYQKNLSIPIVT